MFNIGELIIYSAHGICRIDDICEKIICGKKRNYYELHPVDDYSLSISVPVESDKVAMLQLVNKEEAEEILESFSQPGIEWIEANTERNQVYSNIVKTGDRKDISKIASTLMRQKRKIEVEGKKFHVQDNKLLTYIQNILFTELAFKLNTTFESINRKVTKLINENDCSI
ncbi:CarD family transcriptional regulator [uncultured Clostridium sp.]|uniref:CarD family transcriptional regulator n=1 Tax=uncultured Clostridium sp. TaxID=59620 RepID=UPI0032179795